MTDEDRNYWMDKLERVDAKIAKLSEQIREWRCRCGERECDDCAFRRFDERELEDLERERRCILRQFPEMKYAN